MLNTFFHFGLALQRLFIYQILVLRTYVSRSYMRELKKRPCQPLFLFERERLAYFAIMMTTRFQSFVGNSWMRAPLLSTVRRSRLIP